MRMWWSLLVACVAIAGSLLTAQEQTVYKPGNGVTLPIVTRSVRPQYTAEALHERIQGTVTLDAVVLADGKVGDVTVTRSLDKTYGLDEQAVKAMKEWEFKPGTKDGKAVAVQVAVEMHFTLK